MGACLKGEKKPKQEVKNNNKNEDNKQNTKKEPTNENNKIEEGTKNETQEKVQRLKEEDGKERSV